MTRDFPEDFLFGSSTAAHQVEGGNDGNDWWDWELADGGSHVHEPSGIAIDQWTRYRQDFELLAGLGHRSHRMSIEWSRLEPEPGTFDDLAFEHYADVLDTLAGRGMTPFVTMYHFTLPRWFAAKGGWLADDAVDRYAAFVGEAARRLGAERLPFVCTVNEPQIIPMEGYLLGEFPPGHQDLGEFQRVNRVLADAHRAATAALHAVSPDIKAGTCLQLMSFQPADPDDDGDRELAASMHREMNEMHVDDLRAGGDVGDWVGVQYYTRVLLDSHSERLMRPPPEGAETTLMGWEVYPEGLRMALDHAATVGLPMYITENGIATSDDTQRVRYLESHLRVVADAVADGLDVRGYTYWSAFDNFEWAKGYPPTFGMVRIDRDNDLARVVLPSALAFQRVIETGRVDSLTT